MKVGDLVKRKEPSPFCPDVGIIKQMWDRHGQWLAEVWWLDADPAQTEKVRIKDLENISSSNLQE